MPRPVSRLYVKTNYMGYIAALSMMGPIVTPMQITQDQAVAMLKSGMRNLFEYNPTTKQTRLLTVTNIGKAWPNEKSATTASAPAAKAAATPAEPVVLTGAPAPAKQEEAPQAAPEVVETKSETVADQFNENELIDESKVDWNSMTKAERKAMRAKIEAQKAALAAAETPTEDKTE
ncbi:MAG: hypothetical protein NC548_05620 [Lachnospiraceae bacterium]|nr:hypothetical protein [Lachnospiraceae bacterium]